MDFIVDFSQVSFKYPTGAGVSELSFQIEKGKIHGLLGPNGAGKSTTMKLLTGLISPQTGTIRVLGHDPVKDRHHIASQIGYLPELPPLYPMMNPLELLIFTRGIRNLSTDKERCLEILKDCGLSGYEKRTIQKLSKGTRQKLGIAQAIVHNPKIVILDEPTVGLDPQSIIEIRDVIKKLSQKMTVILSTHMLHEVQEVCDELLILKDGHKIISGSIQELGRDLINGMGLEIEIGHTNEQVLNHLRTFSNGNIQIKERGNKKIISMVTKGKDDIRPQLCKLLVEDNCEIYEMRHRELGVEDIFMKVINSDAQSEVSRGL